jgi:hypothetical protein
LLDAEDCNNQLSAIAPRVTVPGAEQLGGAWTVQLHSAGVGSTFDAASVARTRSWWLPGASPAYVAGDAHDANAAASREHSNVAPASFAVKANAAVALVVVAGGPEVMVLSGAVVSGGGSTVHSYVAGVGSGVPATVDTTSNSWSPTARPVSCTGEVHVAGVAPSSAQVNVAPPRLASKANVASILVVVSAGAAVMVVCGAVGVPVTIQPNVAGVASTFSSWSTDRTSKTCGPGASSSGSSRFG